METVTQSSAWPGSIRTGACAGGPRRPRSTWSPWDTPSLCAVFGDIRAAFSQGDQVDLGLRGDVPEPSVPDAVIGHDVDLQAGGPGIRRGDLHRRGENLIVAHRRAVGLGGRAHDQILAAAMQVAPS